MQFLIFRSIKARDPSRRLNLPWDKFAETLVAPASRKVTSDKKAVPLFGPFTLRDGTTRRSDNVTTVNILFVDVDDGTPANDATKLLRQHGIAHAVYSTHSSTRAHPKYRIVAPLKRPVSGAQWRETYERICRAYRLPFDPKTVDPSRIFYLPSAPRETTADAFAWTTPGLEVDPDDAGTTKRRHLNTTVNTSAQFDPLPDDAEPFRLPPKIQSGGRNDTLHRYAWHLLGRDEELAYQDLLDKLNDANTKRCVPPLPEGEVRAIADSAVSHYERRARDDAAPQPTDDGEFDNPPIYPPRTERYMYDLNGMYAYIMQQSAVWKVPVAAFASPEKCKHDQSNVELPVTARKNAKRENAFNLWMRWPYRRQYAAIEFTPGEPQTTQSGALNLWSGWPQEPVEGDVSLWHKLMNHVFGDAHAERRWFEQWCAWPVQHPGAKLLTAVILWSAVEGSGKSTVGLTVGALYRPHFRTISGRDLARQHNAWTKDTSFVLGEEVRSEDSRIDADNLKHLITGETVPVEPKYVDRFELPNRMNFLFTSNHPAAFFLTEHSRRSFVWEVERGKLPLELGVALEQWRKSDAGRAALMHYFMHLDTSDFRPTADAPVTESKRAMIESGRTDLERWLSEQLSADDVVSLFDLKQRYRDEAGGSNTSTTAILNYLRRHWPELTSKVIRVNSKQRRLWALTRPWESATEKEWETAFIQWLEGALLKR